MRAQLAGDRQQRSAAEIRDREMDTFDYVIVGAGSAGCVLADRLSADQRTQVAVLEAGGSDRNLTLHVPKALAFTDKFQWKYETEPFGPFGQVEPWSRGKVLGGSSSVNGMVYNRGARADYERLGELGNPGWGWEKILATFRTIEDHQLGASPMRGAGGPLGVCVAPLDEPVSDALAESALALGAKRVDDINSSDEERIGAAPATIRRGMRVSAAKAFLHPASKRPNLTVRTAARALRLVFDGDRAVGVEVESPGSGITVVRARREVILSTGSLATPQLLELSGIGSPEVLRSAGIDVRVAAPRVGEGIHEHRCFPIQMRLLKNLGYNKLLASRSAQAVTTLKYMVNRRGPLATPAYDMLWFLRSSDDSTRPDAQVLLTPFTVGVGATKMELERRPGLSLLGFVLRPTSEGWVHIQSSDPHQVPKIQPNYLDTEHDRTVSVNMFRKMRQLVQNSPISEMVLMEIQPGFAVQDDESIIRSGFLYGGPGYHACGAVAMGPTDDFPIDSRLRVRGVDGLRVVDVSILPEMIAGNLNGPIIAMASLASEMIMEDAG
jgi:choline dehydrogenase